MPVIVELLEERWTPTTIQTAFAFHSLPSTPSGTSINLPLSNLGWTFTLSLTPVKTGASWAHNRDRQPGVRRVRHWIPAVFSFRRHDIAIGWGNTSINARLSLGEEYSSSLLGAMDIVLTETLMSSLNLTTPFTIPPHERNKIWLSVTISKCPLVNGLFDARLGPIDEAKVQEQLVRQSGDRVLSRSLTTGKLFDVKFLTNPTRSPLGNPLPTYASLSVLKKHVDLSSSILRESWTNALAALDSRDAKDVEIVYPEDDEYELDSDYDEDEEASPGDSDCERTLGAPEGQQSESDTGRSSSSLSSFEPVSQLQELIKCMNDPPGSSDNERKIRIRFAAHRTWHAFLWYCYTGNLEFCKLKSQVEPGDRYLRAADVEGLPPISSPKSMYRLADLIGNKNLKAKALAAIKKRMTEANVLDETFSVFSFKYPEVQKVQLGVLMEHCGSPKVKAAFLRTMKEYGNMPHAESVLSAFYDNLVA